MVMLPWVNCFAIKRVRKTNRVIIYMYDTAVKRVQKLTFLKLLETTLLTENNQKKISENDIDGCPKKPTLLSLLLNER